MLSVGSICSNAFSEDNAEVVAEEVWHCPSLRSDGAVTHTPRVYFGHTSGSCIFTCCYQKKLNFGNAAPLSQRWLHNTTKELLQDSHKKAQAHQVTPRFVGDLQPEAILCNIGLDTTSSTHAQQMQQHTLQSTKAPAQVSLRHFGR